MSDISVPNIQPIGDISVPNIQPVGDVSVIQSVGDIPVPNLQSARMSARILQCNIFSPQAKLRHKIFSPQVETNFWYPMSNVFFWKRAHFFQHDSFLGSGHPHTHTLTGA